MGLGSSLRGAMSARATRFSVRQVQRFGAASLLTRSTNDMQQIQLLVFAPVSFLPGQEIAATRLSPTGSTVSPGQAAQDPQQRRQAR
jgi:hypothetical protein